jgi:hypothetical protein
MELKISKLVSLSIFALLLALGSSCIAQQQDFSPLDRYIQTTMQEWNSSGVFEGIRRSQYSNQPARDRRHLV